MNRENIEDLYEVSPTQQGLLFHSLYAPDSWVYLEQFSGALHGTLDARAFERAWQRVLDRHAVLRTSFYWKELDKPLQLVHRQVPIPVEQHNWSGLSPVDQQESLNPFCERTGIAASTYHTRH